MSNHLYESVAYASLPSHYTKRDKTILMALCYRANAEQGHRIWASAADIARIACCSVRNVMTKLRMFVFDGILKRLTNPKPRRQSDGSCKTDPVVYSLNLDKLTQLGAKICAILQTKERPTTTKSKVNLKSYPQDAMQTEEFLNTAQAKQTIESFANENALVDTPGSINAFARHYFCLGKAKIMSHWGETLLRWLEREKRVKNYGDINDDEKAAFWKSKHDQSQLDRREARMLRCGVKALPGRSLDDIDALCDMVEKRGDGATPEKQDVPIAVSSPEVTRAYLAKIKGMLKLTHKT